MFILDVDTMATRTLAKLTDLALAIFDRIMNRFQLIISEMENSGRRLDVTGWRNAIFPISFIVMYMKTALGQVGERMHLYF